MFDDDTFSHQGAKRLKAKIEAYWNRRGYAPLVRVVREDHGEHSIYVVRSDITFDAAGYPHMARLAQ